VRGPTLQGESTGSTSIEAREAMLVEVDQLRTHLLSQANATDLNRPAFGGTATFGTTDDAAGSYLGDAAAVRRTVDDGVTLRIDITGAEAFSPAAADLFASPTQIAPHLRTDFTQLEAHLGQLDTVTRRVRATLGDIGAPMNRLEISREAGPARGDNVTEAWPTPRTSTWPRPPPACRSRTPCTRPPSARPPEWSSPHSWTSCGDRPGVRCFAAAVDPH
jgi:flagellar hook-associated protein 3 FlgL